MESTVIPSGTVVVGVDGSPSAARALEWAIDQAALERRPLTLASALGGPSDTMWLDQAGIDHQSTVEGLRQAAEATIAEAAARVTERAPDLELYEVRRVADPRVMLLDLAEDAAMLVLGSHGRGPVRRLLLGSVSSAVARHATCPVVVVRPHPLDVDRRGGVLVGVDGTAQSLPTLEFAYREAALRHQPLTVLHCFWDVRSAAVGPAVVTTDGPQVQEERLLLAESVSGMAEKFPEVEVTTELARGMADEALVRAAERMDLLVVGRHAGHRLADLAYGTVAATVVDHATTVVAVVPTPRAA